MQYVEARCTTQSEKGSIHKLQKLGFASGSSEIHSPPHDLTEKKKPGMAFGRKARPSGDTISETALACVFTYIEDPADRSSISRVCKKWYDVDCLIRKDVTISCCYAIEPFRLTLRFKALEAVKLKGKPRCSMFQLIPDNWGGYAKPWISEISVNYLYLKSIHLRRMVVCDVDLVTIARERGHMLQILKLDKCSDFSTIGLEAITRSCRSLRVLFLDESLIEDKGGQWLHELALHNRALEVLNFYGTGLIINVEDLLTIALNCKSLHSLKLSELELESLGTVLSKMTALKELGGFSVGSIGAMELLSLPGSLTSLVALYYSGVDEGDSSFNTLVQPIASRLKKIDLQCACLSVQGHCQLLSQCSNLETLEVFNAIGDEGLEILANSCKNLRRLRVERGDQEVQQGFITHKGLTSVAASCHSLEYIAVYVTDINNAALAAIASNCPNLKDFRIVLLDDEEILDFPLDEGVQALMQKCVRMHRLALYLRAGFLTDQGMQAIGLYGHHLRWALFGLLGETDQGLSLFADGCPNLEKLEIRDCVFTEAAIAASVLKMKSLKYVWVQGYKSTDNGQDLLPLCLKSWIVEYIPAGGIIEHPTQFVAYRSLARQRRTDCPDNVICLG